MKPLSYFILFCFLLGTLTSYSYAQPANTVDWKKVNVLVYTKNGKGYVHDNIPHAVKAIQKLSQEKGFKVDVTDDPAAFTEQNLKKYTFLMFPSTNNDVFDTDEQRVAFRRYIEAGGGFVGLHSVTGTERNWKWFKQMVGGTFLWHPTFQPIKVKVMDKAHPTVQGLPEVWERADECYFLKELYPGIKVVMAHDLSSLDKKEEEKIKSASAPFADYYPAAWYQNFDGGTIWITTLGHDKLSYEDPIFMKHVLQGMHFVASQSKSLNYTKAYATTKDNPLP
ncbi:ThuA domain-containing protein [Pontibacter diazotrophicus]|uniref:ThuA domain-containing protein n=1 Tax=Pontibacter diazotrophicus TaxID=1400979 RepID=A0A3D8LBC5_9BACT|nr:ThuA domain-containing protein [Pontibacter diazotrophicus]RDV14705.1 ThuA domain-containing protein [Pontibacter diazotrophicus]